MSFTFLLHPDIEYQLSGLAAVANAPGIKAAVNRAVMDAIATYLVEIKSFIPFIYNI